MERGFNKNAGLTIRLEVIFKLFQTFEEEGGVTIWNLNTKENIFKHFVQMGLKMQCSVVKVGYFILVVLQGDDERVFVQFICWIYFKKCQLNLTSFHC